MLYHRDMRADDSKPKWRFSVRNAGPLVPWRPGYFLPAYWQATVDGPDLSYLVELEFVVGDNGPSCRAVRFIAREGGIEISPREIRHVPVGRCVQLAIGAVAKVEDQAPPRPGARLSYGGERPGTYAPAGVEAFKLARPSDSRTKDARLREVAEIYKAAEESGKPTQAVQDALYMSYSTAARLVGEARRRGFLPPSRRNQRKDH